MFDGQTEQPLYLVLLLAAGLVAAPFAAYAWLRPPCRGHTAEAGGLAAFGAIALFTLALLLIPLNVLHALDRDRLVWLFGSETVDTGPVELISALAFVTAGILALRLGWTRLPRGSWLSAAFLALGVGAVLVGIEEVSWGQQLFHFESEGVFAEKNLQGETNLHNFVAGPLLDPLYAAAGWLMIGAALLLRLHPRTPLFAPVRPMALSLARSRYAVPLMLATGMLLQHDAFEELAELAAAMLLVYALETLRRDLPRDAAAAAAARRPALGGA